MYSFRNIAVRLIPERVKSLIGRLNKLLYKGTEYHCPICDSNLKRFLKLPNKFNVIITIGQDNYTVQDFETLNAVNYMCPVCRSSDRDRLYALYLKNKMEILEPDAVLIHFAPEKSLSKYLRQNKKQNYLTVDLYMKDVDHNLDMTDMHVLGSNSVDCFICSHILEHILEDTKALQELYRILKPSAWGIVMVPVIPGLKETYEDSSKTTAEERLKFFGQEDHVRIYGKGDFVSRVERSGFVVHQLGVDCFGADLLNKSGITSTSVLYVVEKPDN